MPGAEEGALQELRQHDPAQAIMESTRALLVGRSNAMLQRALNKTDLENVRIVFSLASLSGLTMQL